jgi:signal transduction histidine kinase/ActR/RegA family two-component response regulator
VRINITRREHGVATGHHTGEGDGTQGTMLSVEDVTPHRRIRQLEHDKAAAEAMTRAQTEFLSRMSHELRTPLNAMLGYAQLMREDARVQGDTQLRHRLQVVEGAGWHLAAMINDILDLSRLQAGKLPLKPEPTALLPLIEEARSMMAGEADSSQVTIEPLEAPDAARLWVMADATRLRQVLANLLSNAIKYNRPGGWVRLAARRVMIHREAHVELQVRDNGLGFSAEQLDHLFEPFNRLGREASAQAGTGIGLVITRSLVELMGGRLAVSSSEGQGSTFSVRLAAAEPRAEHAPEPPAGEALADAPRVDYGERHVVYIEDNPVNGEIMLAILQARPQIRLDLHADGEAGLAAVRADPPDLLLLDLQLGRLNGLDILAALRADPRTAALPVLVVSADVLPATVDAAKAAGAHGFIEKPLYLADTLRRVDAVLSTETRVSA